MSSDGDVDSTLLAHPAVDLARVRDWVRAYLEKLSLSACRPDCVNSASGHNRLFESCVNQRCTGALERPKINCEVATDARVTKPMSQIRYSSRRTRPKARSARR